MKVGKGYFEAADNGTIFLDEVGELPLPSQARLLRVLENGEFIKVGALQDHKKQMSEYVAATNLNGKSLNLFKKANLEKTFIID